jgi:hypothetical protein
LRECFGLGTALHLADDIGGGCRADLAEIDLLEIIER